MRGKYTLLVAITCMLLVGISGPMSAQIHVFPTKIVYRLTDLSGTNPGWSFAYAINRGGQVVGDMVNLSGPSQAFRTQPNQQINFLNDSLGVLFGDTTSHAYAINTAGIVVGDSFNSNGSSRAFRSIPGSALEDLNTSTTTGTTNNFVISIATSTYARGINDSGTGWIVGNFLTGGSHSSDFDPYSTHSLVTFGPNFTQPIDASWYANPAFSGTYHVNNRNQTVGWLSPNAYDPQSAFFFDAGTLRLVRIGNLAGSKFATSTAFSVNDSGQVVGVSQTSTTSHAFIFQDLNGNGLADAGELKDLDTMNSSQSGAMSINNGGVAVGYFNGGTEVLYGQSRAAIFQNGTMTALNSLVQGGTGVWTLRVANGINDAGQIVGFMEDNNSDSQARVRHAFRLDPVPVR